MEDRVIDKTVRIILALWVISLIVFGIIVTKDVVDKAWRQEAVKQGHAEWVADKDGGVVWKWKEKE